MEPIDRSTTSKPRQIVTAIVAIEVACPNILDFCLFDLGVLVDDQSVEVVRAFEKECLVQIVVPTRRENHPTMSKVKMRKLRLAMRV